MTDTFFFLLPSRSHRHFASFTPCADDRNPAHTSATITNTASRSPLPLDALFQPERSSQPPRASGHFLPEAHPATESQSQRTGSHLVPTPSVNDPLAVPTIAHAPYTLSLELLPVRARGYADRGQAMVLEVGTVHHVPTSFRQWEIFVHECPLFVSLATRVIGDARLLCVDAPSLCAVVDDYFGSLSSQ